MTEVLDRPGALTGAGLRRVLIVLCATEITSWGVLFYAFTVLAPAITADTGWSAGTVTAAFSLSQVVAALVGIPVGRVLDRRGPRAVMTAGSVLAVPALLGIAWAPTVLWFFAAWTLAGVAMAGVLYQPAFAALTGWFGAGRVRALTTLTLVAGLASTVFAPLTAVIASQVDWRTTYTVLACVLAVVTIPAHAVGLRGSWPGTVTEHGRPAPRTVTRSARFVLLAVVFSMSAITIHAALVALVPLLVDRGLSLGTAAVALGLGGVGQVCGRLGHRRLALATTVRSRTAFVLLAVAVATGLLAAVPGPAAALIAVSFGLGMARGIFTLVQATAVTDRWGAAHYGTLSGVLFAPVLLVSAVAPWVGSALSDVLGGYPAVFAVLAAIGAVAAALSTLTVPNVRNRQ
ncbi:MFS transporter [Actinokineospora sp.]|uniref:MFS transporter n=1 Tax=Actinokineospora sp. TaxID=1872133 RepID=UPI00403827D4